MSKPPNRTSLVDGVGTAEMAHPLVCEQPRVPLAMAKLWFGQERKITVSNKVCIAFRPNVLVFLASTSPLNQWTKLFKRITRVIVMLRDTYAGTWSPTSLRLFDGTITLYVG
jgi:hypothetical protein